MKYEITSEVKQGRLTRNRSTLKKVLEQFEGKVIVMTIQKKKKQRSSPQNKYYWGVIIPTWQDLLYDEWGEYYTKEQTHEFLKVNFNCEDVVNEDTGEVLKRIKSTTENSTTDMEIYHDICRKKAFEFFGAVIPLPNEDLTLNFEV